MTKTVAPRTDVDPRCEGQRTMRRHGKTWTTSCNKLLVRGEVARPWSITCPRKGCGHTNQRR